MASRPRSRAIPASSGARRIVQHEQLEGHRQVSTGHDLQAGTALQEGGGRVGRAGPEEVGQHEGAALALHPELCEGGVDPPGQLGGVLLRPERESRQALLGTAEDHLDRVAQAVGEAAVADDQDGDHLASLAQVTGRIRPR